MMMSKIIGTLGIKFADTSLLKGEAPINKRLTGTLFLSHVRKWTVGSRSAIRTPRCWISIWLLTRVNWHFGSPDILNWWMFNCILIRWFLRFFCHQAVLMKSISYMFENHHLCYVSFINKLLSNDRLVIRAFNVVIYFLFLQRMGFGIRLHTYNYNNF